MIGTLSVSAKINARDCPTRFRIYNMGITGSKLTGYNLAINSFSTRTLATTRHAYHIVSNSTGQHSKVDSTCSGISYFSVFVRCWRKLWPLPRHFDRLNSRLHWKVYIWCSTLYLFKSLDKPGSRYIQSWKTFFWIVNSAPHPSPHLSIRSSRATYAASRTCSMPESCNVMANRPGLFLENLCSYRTSIAFELVRMFPDPNSVASLVAHYLKLEEVRKVFVMII